MRNYHTKDKRNGGDRRQHFVSPKFPFYDCGGNLVTHDRRTLPDRRMEGITVEWISDQELVVELLNPVDAEIDTRPTI